MLAKLVKAVTFRPEDTHAVILDFFAGSASTAHAVLALNQDDGLQRRFICVQIQQPTDRGDYPSIAEVGKERMRRVGKQLSSSLQTPGDVGFRVLSLEPSSFVSWTDQSGDDADVLQLRFDAAESPLTDGWRPENVLVEAMLTEGFPLDSRVTPRKAGRSRVSIVESEHRAHRLIACFDKNLDPAVPDTLGLTDTDVLVCLDTALDDAAKLRLAERCNLKTI
ncbi:MAG: hypothetical protein WKG32_21725 [Gemmatimonadaceae bacterium]